MSLPNNPHNSSSNCKWLGGNPSSWYQQRMSHGATDPLITDIQNITTIVAKCICNAYICMYLAREMFQHRRPQKYANISISSISGWAFVVERKTGLS